MKDKMNMKREINKKKTLSDGPPGKKGIHTT
jgi:hypothetical protein